MSDQPQTTQQQNQQSLLQGIIEWFTAPHPALMQNRSYLTQNAEEETGTIDDEKLLTSGRVAVNTTVNKLDLKCVDYLNEDCSDQDIEYRYCCPVCLRYFNHILQAECCQNYICRLCIGEMLVKAKRTKNTYVVRCCHCMCEDLVLKDVNPDESPREYTDTPKRRKRMQKIAHEMRREEMIRSVVEPVYSIVGESDRCSLEKEEQCLTPDDSNPDFTAVAQKVCVTEQTQKAVPFNVEESYESVLAIGTAENQVRQNMDIEHAYRNVQQIANTAKIDFIERSKLKHSSLLHKRISQKQNRTRPNFFKQPSAGFNEVVLPGIIPIKHYSSKLPSQTKQTLGESTKQPASASMKGLQQMYSTTNAPFIQIGSSHYSQWQHNVPKTPSYKQGSASGIRGSIIEAQGEGLQSSRNLNMDSPSQSRKRQERKLMTERRNKQFGVYHQKATPQDSVYMAQPTPGQAADPEGYDWLNRESVPTVVNLTNQTNLMINFHNLNNDRKRQPTKKATAKLAPLPQPALPRTNAVAKRTSTRPPRPSQQLQTGAAVKRSHVISPYLQLF